MCIFTDHVPHCLFSINIEFHKKLITPVLALFVFVLGLILTWWHVGLLRLWGAGSGASPSTEDWKK